jgi:hypothetical protein
MVEYSQADDPAKIEKMVAMTIAAAKGIVPVGQVILPLTQIAQGQAAPPEIRNLAQALVRLIQGERDALKLAEALTPALTELIWEALDQIEAPWPEAVPAEFVALTFEQLLEKVAEACSGELLLWQQLWTLTQQLAADTTLPPEIQHLGAVLRRILAGERQKFILDDLAPEHRWAVEQLLDWLSVRTITPTPPQS